MDRVRHSVISYLRPSAGAPWRWAEGGSVIIWSDGRTVAFKEEILQVLQALSPQGLPSFGSVVLLLAACHGYVPGACDALSPPSNELPTSLGPKAAILIAARQQLAVQLRTAIRELERVARFPAELRSRLRGKCVLAEAVFERSRGERMPRGFTLEEGFRQRLSDEELHPDAGPGESIPLLRQVHEISSGLRRLSEESLLLRLQTNLESLPEAAPLRGFPAQRARQWLDELLMDPEHRLVALAARDLLAAVRLPRRLTEPDETALGGLADLANRGPLDRLLLSELAHDDLTLTARIALNEALYLRHEPPAHKPPASLAILLDSGIRLWGLPRIFATSTALALIASESAATAVHVWRASGNRVMPVDLLNRKEFVNHLGHLEIEAHPGVALTAFGEALREDPSAHSVLITHADVLSDPDFRRALAGGTFRPGFIASVSRDGRFALHAPPFNSRQPVCESQLSLDHLFSAPPSTTLLGLGGMDPHLPAFLREERAPLLLPFAGRVDYGTQEASGQTLAALADRRLVEFSDLRHGGRLCVPKLPPGKTLWLERWKSRIHLVKAGSQQRPCRWVSLAPGERPEVLDLCSGEAAQAAFRSGEAILVVRDRDVFAYSLASGHLLDRAVSPHRWHRGRFFASAQEFLFVHWDGQRVRFDPLPLPKDLGISKLVTVFDREGYEGPWALNQLCQAISLSGTEKVQVPLPIGQSSHRRSVHISRDGHRIYVTIPDLNWHNLFDLVSGRAEVMREALGDLTILDATPPLPGWNVFRSFDAIQASASDGILLRTRKGAWKSIRLEPGKHLHLIDSRPPAPPWNDFLREPSAKVQATYGCTLEVARWSSGSRAYLDSRGMLHLKSSSEALPELTLALSDGEIAAWCSDHRKCGAPFFIGEGAISEPDAIYAVMQDFLRVL